MSPADRGGLGLPPMPKALAAAAEGALSARTLPPGASPGLVWDRYPRVWRGAAIGAAKERADFLSAFVRDMNSADVKAAGEGALSAVRARLVAAGAISRSFTLTAPLCTGLGLEHPTENGFAFDAVHGLPMLAGTGLKGLARAAAQALGEPEAVVTALLGSDVPDGHGSGDATSPGTVRFWGAWPAVWPKLRVELINPHHPSYQQDQAGSYAGEPEASRGKRPRRRQVADYTEEPVPVSFLALDHSQDLVVFLDALPGRSPDLERVWWW
ncbi:MAG: hypothetical protein RL071_2838, partial [Pseudomonadota bacterium]